MTDNPTPSIPTPSIQVDQQLIDRIVARAQNSMMSLGDPETNYNLDKYADPTLESVATLLVTAHHEKYDLVSIMAAGMQEVEAHYLRELALSQASLHAAQSTLGDCPLLFTTTCNVAEKTWIARAREALEDQ